jgi:glutamine amidotransferase
MITIVDYQMGNLRSVQKAIERVGGTAKISSDPAEIADAQKLILPGVGAFGDAMVEINRRGLADPIRRFAACCSSEGLNTESMKAWGFWLAMS